jgi:transcriptional regulator with XRE-family HTH domain
METLGTRLKLAREQKGFIQQQVASKLEISNGTLSGYERDYRDPDTNTIVKLSYLYEVSTDYLLGRKENQQLNIREPLTETEQLRKDVDLLNERVDNISILLAKIGRELTT